MTLRSTFCKMAVHMLSPHFESLLHCQFAKTRRMSSADSQNGISPLATSPQMPTSVLLPSVPNGMPISMQAHLKDMPPLATIPHMRISGGNVRPPATSNLAPVLPPHQSSHQQSKCRLLAHSRVQRVAYPPLVYGQRCSESDVYTE